MMPLRVALSVLLLGLCLQPVLAGEKILKLRQYTFQCGGTQECSGWRHTFAYIDPTLRNADLPRDAYMEVYTTQEVDARIDAALARRADAPASEDERRQLRDDIAAEVVTQLVRLMAEHETQTRAWLRELVREEIRAAGTR
jgi:hypothetical protein